MTQLRITKYEAALLGLLVALAMLIAVIPWREVARRHTDTQATKYDFSGVVANSKKPRHTPATWRLHTEYSRKSSTLQVQLSHRYERPTADIWLVAEFSSKPLAGPVASAVLRSHVGGTYRSDKVRLARGAWLMSVTGVERSEFKFRIEQLLYVE